LVILSKLLKKGARIEKRNEHKNLILNNLQKQKKSFNCK